MKDWKTWSFLVLSFLTVWFAVWIVASFMETESEREAEWQRTCSALNAEVLKTPSGRVCVRAGEVVYP